jgi:hypothetical protein
VPRTNKQTESERRTDLKKTKIVVRICAFDPASLGIANDVAPRVAIHQGDEQFLRQSARRNRSSVLAVGAV